MWKKITEEDMLEKEKTYTIYHAANVLLKQQYRERKFKKYSNLKSCLLVVEQNIEVLLKIHKFRPIICTTFTEVNETSFDNYRRKNGRGHRRGLKDIEYLKHIIQNLLLWKTK
jgi:Fe-S-cluster containining protein